MRIKHFNAVKYVVITILLTLRVSLSLLLPAKVIPGVYVNTNYERTLVPPFNPDTLFLFEDGSVKSSFFKDAKYEINVSIFYTQLVIHYGFRSRYSKQVTGVLFNRPRVAFPFL